MKKIALVVIAIIAIVSIFLSICLVSTGEVKELRFFGRPYAVLTEGGYLKNPLARSCRLSIATEVVTESGQNVRTADAQVVNVPIAVNYRFKGDEQAVFRFFDLFRSEKAAVEEYIKPNIRAVLAETCREYTCEELQTRGEASDIDEQIVLQAKAISAKQDEEIVRLKDDVKKLLSNEDIQVEINSENSSIKDEEEIKETTKSSGKLNLRENLLAALKAFFDEDGIVEIVNVSITDVDFSNDYDRAIEQKSTIIANIQAQKFKFSGAVETARKEINEARGVANATLREAENVAEATRQQGLNEAAAILATGNARAQGYKELSESLTPEVVKAKALEKWDGAPPKRVLVGGGGESFMIQLPAQQEPTTN